MEQKFSFGDVATSNVGGSRSRPSWYACSTERQITHSTTTTIASPSFGSPSPLSESKRPFAFSSRNFYTSKAVYPLVFRNPVSDCEPPFNDSDINSIGMPTPRNYLASPNHWPDNSSSPSIEYKFQKSETSPDPSLSSYDSGLDVERLDIADVDHKCGVCGRLMWQKSPWSCRRIMRGLEMPVAGVLPCSHVFHAECIEQVTPRVQIRDPPCPLCLKTIGEIDDDESSTSAASEPLKVALRGSRGLTISEDQSNGENSARISGSSLFVNRIKMHLSFSGKVRRSRSGSSLVPGQHYTKM